MAERITPEEGVIKLQSGETLFVDVRDPTSHQEARIPGSLLLNQTNLEDFLATTDRQQPLVVYCYHGHSSQGASDYLAEQGFNAVVSLDGGFEHWRQAHPEHVDSDQHQRRPPPARQLRPGCIDWRIMGTDDIPRLRRGTP